MLSMISFLIWLTLITFVVIQNVHANDMEILILTRIF